MAPRLVAGIREGVRYGMEGGQVQALTDRQREVLIFIREFVDYYHYAPTVREVARRFDFQVSAARQHLLALRRKGFLEWEPCKARTIVLTRASTQSEFATV